MYTVLGYVMWFEVSILCLEVRESSERSVAESRFHTSRIALPHIPPNTGIRDPVTSIVSKL